MLSYVWLLCQRVPPIWRYMVKSVGDTRTRVSLSIEVFSRVSPKNAADVQPQNHSRVWTRLMRDRSHPSSLSPRYPCSRPIDRRDLCHVIFPLLPIFRQPILAAGGVGNGDNSGGGAVA